VHFTNTYKYHGENENKRFENTRSYLQCVYAIVQSEKANNVGALKNTSILTWVSGLLPPGHLPP
jgi:hypothetical protein